MKGVGTATATTGKSMGKAVLHPSQTLRGAGQAVKTATSGGAVGYSHPLFPNGSWYIRMQDDAVTGDACIKEGTMTVARSGETYTLTFDFTSDAGYKVTGSFEGALNVRAQ